MFGYYSPYIVYRWRHYFNKLGIEKFKDHFACIINHLLFSEKMFDDIILHSQCLQVSVVIEPILEVATLLT